MSETRILVMRVSVSVSAGDGGEVKSRKEKAKKFKTKKTERASTDDAY